MPKQDSRGDARPDDGLEPRQALLQRLRLELRSRRLLLEQRRTAMRQLLNAERVRPLTTPERTRLEGLVQDEVRLSDDLVRLREDARQALASG